jgi:hypothetical protein
MMFLASAPEPEPESATVPLVAERANEAATATESMLFIATASTVMSLKAPAAVTIELSIAARLLPVRVFSARVTDTLSAPATVPLEADIATVAATTFEVIDAMSSTLTATEPAASRELLVIRA